MSVKVVIFAGKAVILTFYILSLKMRLLLQGSRIVITLVTAATLVFTGCTKTVDDSSLSIVPVLYTSPVVSGLTTTAAQSTGYVINFTSGSITGYGTCWSSTNQIPTIADSKTVQTTSNLLHFYSDLIGLSANTTYYMRTYATVPSGTYYSDVVQFKTPTNTFKITGTASTYAGTGTAGADNGTLATATFSSPQGVAFDASTGSLYVADSFNNLIRKISSTGNVSVFAGSTAAGFTNGTGTAAQFYSPQYLATDAAGNVYVTDVGNNAIRKITPAGVVSTLAGSGSIGYADGTGATVRFYNPAGLTVDAIGNVYLADRGNHTIRKITAAGVVSTYLTYGYKTPGFGDGSTAPRFTNPTSVAIDSKNNLYVADQGNNAIRIISSDGVVNTLVGNFTNRTDVVNSPAGICVDKNDNVFITDQSGRVMEITAATKALYTLAGTINTNGFANGAGVAATFDSPKGITTDAAGNIYVADVNNNVIRKVVVTTVP